MNVEITNRTTTYEGTRSETIWTTYVATCREDCRDQTDASVYDLVLMLGEAVTMGQTIGCPL